ncbi:MAG: LPXTG cell wall anchor domain-containing protein [Solirubrobacteraceae bacterium]|nr:LPXTG cell wall anchor domain-containing protein [Solirubrobacteraceae bacterium]
MARRIVRAAALCALAVGLSVTTASAHEGNPNFESLIRSVTPAIPGFSAEVLNGDDRLVVRHTGRGTVMIDGYNSEPYIRMRPDGRVEVNLRSPAYYLNQERFYGARVPAAADARAAPRWRVVERTGRFEFHDHRIHWMAERVPQQVTDESQRTKVVDWDVPVRAGGVTGAISGELFWRGTGGGAPVGAFVALGAIVLLGGGSVVLVRRRRRGAGGAPVGASDGSSVPTQREEAW